MKVIPNESEVIGEIQDLESFRTKNKGFLTNMGTLIDSAQLGIIVNVKIDGSCGYHSFVLDLKDIGQENISEKFKNLRLILYKHGENHFQRLKQQLMYGAVPKNYEAKVIIYWKNIMLSRILKEGVNFDEIVKNEHW